ncbi:MAG: type II secretion system protein GspG [Verrucomicrobiota bacterium]
MHSSPRPGRAAFSLIELMAVIVIIVILASLVVGGLGYASERQAKEKCKVQMALLSKAIEAYKLENGSYPATVDGSNGTGGDQILFKALYYDGSSDTTKRIYLPELDPLTSKQGWTTGAVLATTPITDPWGNPFRYRSATGKATDLTQNPDYDLWSMGKDGKTAPSLTDTTSLDDIRNF